MNTIAKLFIEEEWELYSTDIAYYRDTRPTGKPCIDVMGGMVTVSFAPRGNEDEILCWMFADRMDDEKRRFSARGRRILHQPTRDTILYKSRTDFDKIIGGVGRGTMP